MEPSAASRYTLRRMGRHGTKILIVEDDHDIQEALARILEGEGYEVAVAENGTAALEQLRRGNPTDLILLDLMMPVMDGWQFRAEQRTDPRLSGVPVVVLSAHGGSRPEADPLAPAAFLKKPIDLHLLLDTVRRCAAPGAPRLS
jgi:CheY-like chemotaxis protein